MANDYINSLFGENDFLTGIRGLLETRKRKTDALSPLSARTFLDDLMSSLVSERAREEQPVPTTPSPAPAPGPSSTPLTSVPFTPTPAPGPTGPITPTSGGGQNYEGIPTNLLTPDQRQVRDAGRGMRVNRNGPMQRNIAARRRNQDLLDALMNASRGQEETVP